MNIEIEEPYFDKKGREIKENDLIKIFHFKGVNNQGRGRKNYFLYKLVKLKEWKDKKYWAAFDLKDEAHYFYLKSVNSGLKNISVEILN
jgi:hypothetical protein